MNAAGVIIFGVLRQEAYPLEAPIDDPTYEVWAMNASWEPERWDRWFQLHGIEHMWEAHKDIQYLRWLQTVARYHVTKKLYVWEEELHHFPGALAFPLMDLERDFGSYFTGSFAYLMAFAIVLGFGRIYLATGSMAGEEWAIPCIQHYIGIARDRGIEVQADSNSGIFGGLRGSPGLYGRTGTLGGNFAPLPLPSRESGFRGSGSGQ